MKQSKMYKFLTHLNTIESTIQFTREQEKKDAFRFYTY